MVAVAEPRADPGPATQTNGELLQLAQEEHRITGHRIPVHNIAVWHERMGMSPDEIASEYELTLGDVHAALAYYFDHQTEIDRQIEADETFAEELRHRNASVLARKLEGLSSGPRFVTAEDPGEE